MGKKQIAVVLGLIINEKGEVLLPKRNQPELPLMHGKLEFPGGGIEFGEEPEAALIREVKEETGLIVKIVRLLPKVYSNVWDVEGGDKQVLLLSYECKIVGGELGTTDPEVGELKYFKLDEIDYSLCLPKTQEIINLLHT